MSIHAFVITSMLQRVRNCRFINIISIIVVVVFLTPVLNSEGMKKITLCNTKSTKIKLE